MSADHLCVYTAIFGGYEPPNPQPMTEGSDHTWLCFTDDPELEAQGWEVVVVEPTFPLDPHRSSRRVKMLGHPRVREHEASLWIDNSVVLTADPGPVVDEWLAAADIAFAAHSYRATVLDEFLAVLDAQLDEPGRIIEQLEHYARSRPLVLESTPLWGGVIARRWSPSVDTAMQAWWEHLLRYSRRDQLSLMFALDEAGVVPTCVEVDNFESRWHRWPVIPQRREAMRQRQGDPALRRPIANSIRLEREVAVMREELGAARADVDGLRAELAVAREMATESDHRLAALTAELDGATEGLRVAQAQLESVTRERDELAVLDVERQTAQQELDAVRRSRSWRAARLASRTVHAVTGPFRRP